MSTFTVDGVTYTITDHSAGTGLSEADVERMIRNLHGTSSYSNRVGNLDLAQRTIDIQIDNTSQNGTGYASGNGNILLDSSDFEDGAMPYIPDLELNLFVEV